ncbi:MAG: 3-keto-5-aminohexanoate cleavage protein [Alphaproteobacteria bacterium]
MLHGGHVRVGLQHNLYDEKGVFGSNAHLVEKAVRLVREIGPEVATPAEARALLGLRGTQ